jgi:PilZ domain
MNSGNLRRHPRESIAGRVRIAWAPAGGITQYLVCSAVDISEAGLRISSKEALPVGQYIHFQFDTAGLRGSASVRSCTRNSRHNEIGLEFSSSVQWRKKERTAASVTA